MKREYEHLPPSEWTVDEAFEHLTETFNRTCREHPDLMEPYAIALADATQEEATEIMRDGLRKTIRIRFPLASDKKVEAA